MALKAALLRVPSHHCQLQANPWRCLATLGSLDTAFTATVGIIYLFPQIYYALIMCEAVHWFHTKYRNERHSRCTFSGAFESWDGEVAGPERD